MTFKQLTSFLLALMMTALLCPAMADEADEADPIVRAAPLVRSGETLDGMVRVYLSSMGTVTSLDLTIVGSYSVGGVDLTLSGGQQVHVSFSPTSGQITLTINGTSYPMGTEAVLRRHQSNGQSALQIAQANRPSHLYPGDLQLLSVSSGSGYKLYTIVHVFIEDYLYGVVPNEMSSSWPIEALKAQAVAARTYTLNRMNGRGSYTYDVVDTSGDQVYNGHAGSVTNSTRAVDATAGVVLMYGGSTAGTYYTASNGGQTEAVANAWSSTGHPYLRVKDDPFDLANPNSIRRRLNIYANFNHASQNATLKSLLSAKAQTIYGASIATINGVTPHTPKYPAPSRLYTKIDFLVTLSNGSRVTLTFDIFSELESQLGMSINSGKNELWYVEPNGSDFILRAGRYGHGIGMSQRGAQQMANTGYTYDQILGFYYEGFAQVHYNFTQTILPSTGTMPPLGTGEQYATVASEAATLNLRSGPGTGYDVITEIPKGTIIVVTSYGSEWCAVRWGDYTGYVMTKYLSVSDTPSVPSAPTPSPTPSDSPTPTPVGTNVPTGSLAVLNTNAEFFASPSASGESLLIIPEGITVTVLQYGEPYSQVSYGGMTGYILTDALGFQQDAPTPTPSPTPSPTPTPTPMPAPTFTPVNATGVVLLNAHLRQEPDTSSELLMTLPADTEVRVLMVGSGWCQVECAGTVGWMLTSQLHITEEESTPTPTPTPSPTPSPAPSYPAEEGVTEVIDITHTGKTAWIVPTVTSINLREAASDESEILCEIPANARLTVYEARPTWCFVRYEGIDGFVYTRYITYVEPAQSMGIRYINTAKDPLALRAAPSTSANLLTRIPRGQTVTLLEELGDWCRVQYGEQSGYCAARYLSEHRPSSQPVDDTPLLDWTLTAVTGWTAEVAAAEGGTIFLRQWCSLDAPEVAEIANATSVTLVKKGDIWCLISIEGNEGYCLTSQLKLTPPEE